MLDMYYEDPYTLPDKQLSCGVAAKIAKGSNKKVIKCLSFGKSGVKLAFEALILCGKNAPTFLMQENDETNRLGVTLCQEFVCYNLLTFCV